MFDLIMERGLDDFISLAESGLSSARDTEVPDHEERENESSGNA